ncbi:MAG: hypothetical protein DCC71_13300 [Proteobacteria bacterium]|nr:MAG: hypothetical protein DCC71_13300 [Pseudomonadota bacterium]
MRDLATETLETLGLLYGTRLGVEQWARALDAIAALIGGNGALLFVRDETVAELQIAARSSRYLAVDAEHYLTTLARDDEIRWVSVLDAAPPRTIVDDEDIWPDRSAYDAMPSVAFLRALHLYHRVAVRPCAHGGWKDSLTVLYDDRRGGIRPSESRRLALLVPHVARAIEVQRPFRLLHQRFGAVLGALDHLGIGVLLLHEGGEILLSNHEAQRILDAKDGLARSPHGRVEANGEPAVRLRAAVDRASRAARLETREASARLEIPRRTRAEPYLVDVAPLRDDAGEVGGAFRGVLVLMIDPEHRELLGIEGLARSYALSPTETLVCRMLAQGMTLREIATGRGVSVETVKSQARSIYAKTRTRNRRELVRRACSIVPPLLDRHGKRIN